MLCRWGYMLMADPEAALRETRRILRPGARVALAAWCGPGENPWAAIPTRELVDRGHMEPADPDAPGQFAWARAGIIEERLNGAGFGEHEVDVVDFMLRYPSFDDWIATSRDLATRFRQALDGLDAAERDELLATVREKVIPFVEPDGSLALPARTWVAVASA